MQEARKKIKMGRCSISRQVANSIRGMTGETVTEDIVYNIVNVFLRRIRKEKMKYINSKNSYSSYLVVTYPGTDLRIKVKYSCGPNYAIPAGGCDMKTGAGTTMATFIDKALMNIEIVSNDRAVSTYRDLDAVLDKVEDEIANSILLSSEEAPSPQSHQSQCEDQIPRSSED